MFKRFLLRLAGPFLRWFFGPMDENEPGIHSDQSGLFK